MKESKQEIELNYKSLDLFKIVLDIEKYPEYIPWCSNIEIIENLKGEIKAIMIVNYKIFPTQKFISKVSYNYDKQIIKTKYVDGPLKDLYTVWKFKQINSIKSKVIFNVGFEFKNFFHQKLAELFFPLIKDKMIDSFVKRAKNILN